MKKICDYRLCTGCGVCSVKCPNQCVKMIQNEEGFLYPHIDISKCIDCGICIKSCHILSEIASNKGRYYKAWHTDKDVLKKSSSGGVFTALASYVLKHDGVVVGAEINQKTRDLKHVVIQTIDELDKII